MMTSAIEMPSPMDSSLCNWDTFDDNMEDKMEDKLEDSRSTSASGIDSETEAESVTRSPTSSEEDDPSTTPSDNDSEEGHAMKSSRLGAALSGLQLIAKRALGSPRCAADAGTKYNRDMLLQVRLAAGPDATKRGVLPHTISNEQCFKKEVTEPQAAKSNKVNLPPGLSLPPGLALPPGFAPPGRTSSNQFNPDAPAFIPKTNASPFAKNMCASPIPAAALALLPGAPDASEAAKPKTFDVKVFRKELTVIMRELASDWNVGAAVQRVRAQCVPEHQQAAQVTDIVSRAAEEHRGVVRRLSFAFVAGLAKANPSAFEKTAFLAGLKDFFDEVYNDLLDEVPRLRVIIANEFLPAIRSALPAKELNDILPPDLRTA